MKNSLFVSTYSHGTSFSEILESIKFLDNDGLYNIQQIGGKEQLNPISTRNNLLDVEEDVLNYYRNFGQLLDKNSNSQKILFIDFFSPGLDILKYLLEISGKRIKLGALLHGGSFLPRDLYRWNWLKYSEILWFELFDVVYVPSNHLYHMVPKKFQKKVKIMPRGVDAFLAKKTNTSKVFKKNIDVLFPHRLDDDKGIDDLIYIISKLPEYIFSITSYRPLVGSKFYNLLKSYKNVEFIIGETEENHLQTLSESKIVLSCAYQENFGYSVIKSVLSGAIPVLPNREVYPEFFPDSYLYNNLDEAIYYIRNIMSDQEKYLSLIDEIQPTIGNISNFSFSEILDDFYSL